MRKAHKVSEGGRQGGREEGMKAGRQEGRKAGRQAGRQAGRGRGGREGYGRPRERTEPFEFDAICMCFGEWACIYLDDLHIVCTYLCVLQMCLQIFM